MPTQAQSLTARVRTGNTRVTGKEQYYTPPALARELFGEVASKVANLGSRTIIEPAGGTGVFLEAAKLAGATHFVSFDIEPKHPLVKKANFLDVSAAKLPSLVEGVPGAVTISNPPFGRNNSLSIPFFNKAAKHSEYICFIVPRSWRKWSVTNRLDRNFHLIHDQDLKIDYVDDSGVLISQKNRLATCFQIWQLRDTRRPIVKVADQGFIEKTSADLADVALTIFGFGCGTVRTEFDRVPNSTRMFLKLKHPRALAALQSVDFSRFYKNTAYTEALAMPEINYLLNEAILGNPKLIEIG
jgi:predicted RNA methylase